MEIRVKLLLHVLRDPLRGEEELELVVRRERHDYWW